jgi:hypothetical protein
VLPAGHQDQRDCCGCNRKQRDHAGGLGPSCSGRPPDLGDLASKWTASVHHGHFLSVCSASRSACLTGAIASVPALSANSVVEGGCDILRSSRWRPPIAVYTTLWTSWADTQVSWCVICGAPVHAETWITTVNPALQVRAMYTCRRLICEKHFPADPPFTFAVKLSTVERPTGASCARLAGPALPDLSTDRYSQWPVC